MPKKSSSSTQEIEIESLKKQLADSENERIEQARMLTRREKEIVTKDTKIAALSSISPTSAISSITSPIVSGLSEIYTSAKADSQTRTNNIKISPYQIKTLPFRFMAIPPLPGEYDEIDARRTPYPTVKENSSEGRRTFAANLATYVRAGGKKSLMSSGNYDMVDDLLREYGKFNIKENIANEDLVRVIYEQEIGNELDIHVESFYAATSRSMLPIEGYEKTSELVKTHLKNLAKFTDIMVFNETFAKEVLHTVVRVIGKAGTSEARENIRTGNISNWQHLDDFIRDKARDRDLMITKLTAQGVFSSARTDNKPKFTNDRHFTKAIGKTSGEANQID